MALVGNEGPKLEQVAPSDLKDFGSSGVENHVKGVALTVHRLDVRESHAGGCIQRGPNAFFVHARIACKQGHGGFGQPVFGRQTHRGVHAVLPTFQALTQARVG